MSAIAGHESMQFITNYAFICSIAGVKVGGQLPRPLYSYATVMKLVNVTFIFKISYREINVVSKKEQAPFPRSSQE